MAKEKKSLGLEKTPEEKLAIKISKKHKLKIPFNLNQLTEKYAEVLFMGIPIEGVDGVCINLKKSNRKPTIIVNSNKPKTRQVFTLAHELGHVIIPWHVGNIIDDISSEIGDDYIYSVIEQEANRFAAELLMPSNWLIKNYTKYKNEADFLEFVIDNCNVSIHAAIIRMMEILPSNIIYAAIKEGKVIQSGKTRTAVAIPPRIGLDFNEINYFACDQITSYSTNSVDYYFWKLTNKLKTKGKNKETRTWREILNLILDDIKPEGGIEQYKKTLNGIIAHVNGKLKRELNHTYDNVVISCINMLKRENLVDFINHKDFESFIKIRVLDFFR